MNYSLAILALDAQFGMEHFVVYDEFEHKAGYRLPIEDLIYPDCIRVPAVAPESPLLHKASRVLCTPGDETSDPASKILHVDPVIDILKVIRGALNLDTRAPGVSLTNVVGHLAQKLPHERSVAFPISEKVCDFLDYLISCIEKDPLEPHIYSFTFQTKGENACGVACEGEKNRLACDLFKIIFERGLIVNEREIELDHRMSIPEIDSYRDLSVEKKT